MSVQSVARRWQSLSPRDRARFLAVVIVWTMVSVRLRFEHVGVLSRRLGLSVRQAQREKTPVLSDAHRVYVAATHAIASRAHSRECLRFALVAGYFLRDLKPVLRFGVATKERGFAAHAWLEVGALHVEHGRASDFTPLQ